MNPSARSAVRPVSVAGPQSKSWLAAVIDLMTIKMNGAGSRPFSTFVLLVFAFGAYAAFFQFSGISIGRWGVDAADHQLAIEYGVGATSAADKVLAQLGPYLRIGDAYSAVPTILLVLLLSAFSVRATPKDVALIMLVSIPIIFQLKFPAKEAILIMAWTFLAPFILFCGRRVRLVACLLVLFVLGITFRKYYFIAAGLFVALYFLRDIRRFLPVMGAGLIVAGAIPQVRDTILAAKYLVSRNVSAAAASKIPQFFSDFSLFAFVGNYVVAAFYFLFPLANGPRIQELYLQVSVIVIVLSTTFAVRHRDRATAALFMAIVFTLPTFVAELGTFSRHVGAILPLLIMSLHVRRS